MNFKRALMMGVLSAVSLVAAAQWQWLDKDGRKVFSDRPPPPETPEKNILRQPGGRANQALAAASAASSPASAAAVGAPPRPSGKNAELEEKKKQAEQLEAANKKAEEEKYLKAKAENCSRARLAKAGMDSGARIARINSNGEREILDDSARAAETKRLQDVVQSECN